MATHELSARAAASNAPESIDPVDIARARRDEACAELAALPADAPDSASAPLQARVDSAEADMLASTACTVAGIEAQLLAGLSYLLWEEGPAVHAAANSGDLAALERAGLDWGPRLIVAAAKSLRRLEWLRARDSWIAADAACSNWEGLEDTPDALAHAGEHTWRVMMQTPAPDMAALRFKLEHMLEVDQAVDAMEGWPGHVVQPVLADLARLLPAEPEARR